jgi:hypothetical protein
MSGVEAIAVVGLIDACIGITKTILDIGRAVHDAQGLPPKLRDLFDKLPAIEDLLENAREACDEGGIDDDGIYTHAQPLLQQCETALAKLRDIIRKACPKDGDSRKSRIWKGTKTVFFGRDSQVQALLVVVLNNLKLLEQQKIYAIGDKLDELATLTESLGQDDGGKYSHSGTGNILVVEGGTSENHVQGGSNNRMIIKPGVYHEGSSST